MTIHSNDFFLYLLIIFKLYLLSIFFTLVNILCNIQYWIDTYWTIFKNPLYQEI